LDFDFRQLTPDRAYQQGLSSAQGHKQRLQLLSSALLGHSHSLQLLCDAIQPISLASKVIFVRALWKGRGQLLEVVLEPAQQGLQGRGADPFACVRGWHDLRGNQGEHGGLQSKHNFCWQKDNHPLPVNVAMSFAKLCWFFALQTDGIKLTDCYVNFTPCW
jgi:hypothetical protein